MTLVSHYNIEYSEKTFLKPLLGKAELLEMEALEKICFPPGESYDLRTLRRFVSLNGIGVLRWYEEIDGHSVLAAYHMFDCFMAELITIDVHPDWRRHGIARRLLDTSMARLREIGHRKATCQIAVDNESSLALHGRYGFKPVRRIPNYYGKGHDAYQMQAAL